MGRPNREDLDRWFDHSVYPPKRLVYIGDGNGTGTEVGEVGPTMHELAIKGLTFLDSWSEAPITIHLNTNGGDWYHGMGIYDCIQALKAHVTIIVTGSACSMGSLILQAGDLRVMGPHSVLMIHDGTEFLHSDSKAVENWAKKSAAVRQEMYKVYLEKIRVKKPRFTMKQVEHLCSHDSIFTPEKCIEYGLADQVLERIS
jgi:ATP-dependent Clp protease protease subunit